MTLTLKAPKVGTHLDYNTRISYVSGEYFVLRINAILASGYVVYKRTKAGKAMQTYTRHPIGKILFYRTLKAAKDYIARQR